MAGRRAPLLRRIDGAAADCDNVVVVVVVVGAVDDDVAVSMRGGGTTMLPMLFRVTGDLVLLLSIARGANRLYCCETGEFCCCSCC